MRKLILGTLLLVGGSSSAWADQRLVVPDNGEVLCRIAQRGITRISLEGDRFVSDVRRPSGDGQGDISMQNEPNRGDIYVSLPDNYAARTISFFATTGKGFTYKFSCSVVDSATEQVFIVNQQLADAQLATQTGAQDAWDLPIAIIKGMAAKAQLPGFTVTPGSGRPVYVGTLKVQVISVYSGARVRGKVVDIENFGTAPVDLTEQEVSPANTIAATLSKTHLAPHEHTTAYVVLGH